MIQKHAARRLHYDLRLELDGVMKSWAVTRGPSLDPGEKRLAVHVEDHPVEYNTFEGTIPQGEYGGGTVMIWDRGQWTPEGDPHKGLAKGHLTFDLDGEKLHGRWHLVRLRARPKERRDNWLLIKSKDEAARGPRGKDILEEEPLSVATGRSIDEIAEGKGKKRVWHSNRDAKKAPAKPKAPAGKPVAKPRARAKAAAKTGAQKKSSRAAHDRLPDFVPPSLATLHSDAPRGAEWLHEIKYDGYRIQARLDHGKVRLLTRKKPGLDASLQADRGRGRRTACRNRAARRRTGRRRRQRHFELLALQTDLKDGRGDRLVYYVFDLLYLDGRDLTGEPLVARKAELAAALQGQGQNRPHPLRRAFCRRRRGDPQARLRLGARRYRIEA